jgi:hypothetical protein
LGALLAALLVVLLLGLLLRAAPALLLIGHGYFSLDRGEKAPRPTNHWPYKDVPTESWCAIA